MDNVCELVVLPRTAARYIVHLETSKKILLRRVMLDTQWLQEDWVCTNLYSTVLSHHIKSDLAWRMFFKPEKCDLFVAFNFTISYTPNCTVSSYNFEKFSGGGAHRAPSPDPSPASSRASPSVRVSPSVLGRFAPSTQASPSNSSPKKPTWTRPWLSPLAFLSGCALHKRVPLFRATLYMCTTKQARSQSGIMQMASTMLWWMSWWIVCCTGLCQSDWPSFHLACLQTCVYIIR